ncbi:endonuclease/exonuclease/phosphatase family protein [Symmachiella macrocystis]|nr:endonuclease/exonuclease/phosphatase family protein [Symmachiella macrocystis]
MCLFVVVAGIAWYGSWRQPVNFSHSLKLSTPPQFSSHQRDTIRIGVFNIHGCKGKDGKRDVGRIAQCIHDMDIVSLHEVRGSYASNQAHELGELLGMSAVFAPTEWRWGRNDFGNGLLTNVEFSQMHQIPLAMSGHAYRNALLTSFRLEDKTVQLLIAHVDLSEDRERQLSAVTNLFLTLKTPAILLGDLNVKATDPRMRGLMATPGVRSALAATPGRGRDWVIMKGFRTVSAAVIDNEASDHAFVQTELQLLNEPNSAAPRSTRGQAKQASTARDKH